MALWQVKSAAWPAHAPEVAALFAQAFNVPTNEILVEMIKCTGALLVRTDDDKLVGALVYTLLDRRVDIYGLATEATHRKRGIADALMKAVLAFARDERRVTLALGPEYDTGLPDFFPKYGFRSTGQRSGSGTEFWERPAPSWSCTVN